jgi:hypothetical protein
VNSIPQPRAAAPIPHPSWCRPDLCETATVGREVWHTSSRMWSRHIEAAPGRGPRADDTRLSLQYTRRDERDPGTGEVTVGDVVVILAQDRWAPAAIGSTEGTWLPEPGLDIHLAAADAADLGVQATAFGVSAGASHS